MGVAGARWPRLPPSSDSLDPLPEAADDADGVGELLRVATGPGRVGDVRPPADSLLDAATRS